MKLILFFVISCLAIHNGKGAPRKAVYKFVRCNPEGDQANCVTHQSPEMEWSPDLPAKLPASTARYLEAEPVEDESPLREEEEEEQVVEDESPMMNQEGESPVLYEEGSGAAGYYEGSASEAMYMDQAFVPTGSETGSGESVTEKDKGGEKMTMRRLFPSRSLGGEATPAELRDDHLLQL
ncbi:serglycin [Symphorus nematophorus]